MVVFLILFQNNFMMSDNFDLLVSGGLVYLNNQKIEEQDIGIKDSKIVAIGNLKSKKFKKIDVKNLY